MKSKDDSHTGNHFEYGRMLTTEQVLANYNEGAEDDDHENNSSQQWWHLLCSSNGTRYIIHLAPLMAPWSRYELSPSWRQENWSFGRLSYFIKVSELVSWGPPFKAYLAESMPFIIILLGLSCVLGDIIRVCSKIHTRMLCGMGFPHYHLVLFSLSLFPQIYKVLWMENSIAW